ncbi:MAG: hypothetical protein KDB11_33500 [Planctomycetales bacterium]|nr:hypothetical protein [Planctomycetales bacterium]
MPTLAVRMRLAPGPVYEAVLARCPPASLPAPWDRIPICDSCYQCPDDPDALFRELVSRFDRQQLQNSGAVVVENDTLVLDESLRDSAEFIIAIRKAPDGKPLDLLTSRGCISGADWPVLAAFYDHRVRSAMKPFARKLIVAFTMADVVLLRSLGLPVTLGTGLEEFDIAALDELAEKFGWDDSERKEQLNSNYNMSDTASDNVDEGVNEEVDSDVEQYASRQAEPMPVELDSASMDPDVDATGSRRVVAVQPQLVLLDWSPRNLSDESPVEVARIVEYLNVTRCYFGIQAFDEVMRWTPNRMTIDGIGDCLRYGVVEAARKEVQLSFTWDRGILLVGHNRAIREPENVIGTLNRLQEAIRYEYRRSPDFHEGPIDKVWEEFEKQLKGDFELPLLTAALECEDPVRKQRLLALAGLSRITHQQAFLLNQTLSRQAKEVALNGTPLPASPGLKDYLATLKVVASLTKERRK